MNERVIATGYSLKAISLVIHEVTCQKCKAISRFPQGTMLRLQRGSDSIYVPPKVSPFDVDLPREKREVRTTVDACEECFKMEKREAQRGDGLYSLLDRRVGTKNELFIRPTKVEDIEFRMAGNAINNAHPAKRGRKPKPAEPEVQLKDLF